MRTNNKKSILIAGLIFGLSIFSRICLSNYLILENQKLKDYYTQRDTLLKEISKLSLVESKLSSLEYVEEKALQLGFSPMKDTLLSVEYTAPTPMASLSSQ